jgi:hypothetical protein
VTVLLAETADRLLQETGFAFLLEDSVEETVPLASGWTPVDPTDAGLWAMVAPAYPGTWTPITPAPVAWTDIEAASPITWTLASPAPVVWTGIEAA